MAVSGAVLLLIVEGCSDPLQANGTWSPLGDSTTANKCRRLYGDIWEDGKAGLA